MSLVNILFFLINILLSVIILILQFTYINKLNLWILKFVIYIYTNLEVQLEQYFSVIGGILFFIFFIFFPVLIFVTPLSSSYLTRAQPSDSVRIRGLFLCFFWLTHPQWYPQDPSAFYRTPLYLLHLCFLCYQGSTNPIFFSTALNRLSWKKPISFSFSRLIGWALSDESGILLP